MQRLSLSLFVCAQGVNGTFVCFRSQQQQQTQEEVASNTSSATTPETLRKVDSPSEITNDDDKSTRSTASSDSPVPKIEHHLEPAQTDVKPQQAS